MRVRLRDFGGFVRRGEISQARPACVRTASLNSRSVVVYGWQLRSGAFCQRLEDICFGWLSAGRNPGAAVLGLLLAT